MPPKINEDNNRLQAEIGKLKEEIGKLSGN
jgi:hypothetical protein